MGNKKMKKLSNTSAVFSILATVFCFVLIVCGIVLFVSSLLQAGGMFAITNFGESEPDSSTDPNILFTIGAFINIAFGAGLLLYVIPSFIAHLALSITSIVLAFVNKGAKPGKKVRGILLLIVSILSIIVGVIDVVMSVVTGIFAFIVGVGYFIYYTVFFMVAMIIPIAIPIAIGLIFLTIVMFVVPAFVGVLSYLLTGAFTLVAGSTGVSAGVKSVKLTEEDFKDPLPNFSLSDQVVDVQ